MAGFRPLRRSVLRSVLLCAAIAGLMLPSTLLAQRKMSVAQLETFIRSSIQLKHPDRQVADVVDDLQLTERLTASAVETLQGLGAGPRTLAALEKLSEQSAGLGLPSATAPPEVRVVIPAPSESELRAILAETRQKAIDYTAGLPDFVCTQITRRYFDPTGRESWRRADVIQEQLSYVDQMEDYRVVLINNLPVTDVSHRELGGTTSSGEWGTMLYNIFKPETETDFRWERWATLRGRRMYVFSYRVRQSRSDYGIFDQASGRSMVAGHHGLIYVDRDSKRVMRIRMDADGLGDFPINAISIDLNYDFIEISGQEFVLPLKASLKSAAGEYLSRNEVEFRRYSKFSTDAVISFDLPDELPEDQFEEQPAVPDQPGSER